MDGFIPLIPLKFDVWMYFLGGSSHDRMMFTSTKLVAPVTQAMSLHLLQALSIESMCFLNKYIYTVYIYMIHTYYIILYIHICQINILYFVCVYIYIYIPRSIYQHSEALRHPLFTFTKMPRKQLLVCCVQWRVRRCHCRFPNSATWLCLDGWMISHKVRPPEPTTR